MTNVLPIPAQKNLWGVHRARFLIILSLVLLALAAAAALALVPSYVALEANTVSPDDAVAQKSTAAESMKSMTRSQALLNALAPVVLATSSPTADVEKALALRPKGVTVGHIRYISSSKTIQLGGTASRDALTAYRAALENDGTFTTVSVPVAALVGTSGQFSVTLQGNF